MKRLRVRQVAERLGCSDTKVVSLIRSGRLPAIDLADPGSSRRAYRVLESAVETFERDSRSRAAAPHPVRPRAYRPRVLHA